ncbi:hypothetical protein [uncultured Ruegeria sp.]|uniref:hypothetical protein n=1 Tax=uncultured Ruegeria sp. TaxID=259304 RepID=UPI0026122599|nr:hypothetical protein [uncultured Ruegeria sp.]
MSGADIAAEVAAALAEAGEAVGDRPLYCTLRKPIPGFGPTSPHDNSYTPEPTLHELTAVQDTKQIRDQSGTLIGETRRTLLVNATGAKPEKQDGIVIGVKPADVTILTKFETIIDVEEVAPGGVALMYELDLGT